MKRRNGFTLVELLAIIVVLALIMVIAIPTVFNVIDNARKQSFYIYSTKVYDAALNKYLADYNTATSNQLSCTTYKIPEDLDIADSGNYVGWVKVERVAKDSGNVELSKTLNETNGLYSVRYCIKQGANCDPNVQESNSTYRSDYWNVQEDAEGNVGKTTTVRVNAPSGYHLCVSYQYPENGKMTKSQVDCAYQTNIATGDEYEYKVTLTMKDSNNAVENFILSQKSVDDSQNKEKIFTAMDRYIRNHRNNLDEMRIDELVCSGNGGYISNDPNQRSTTVVTTSSGGDDKTTIVTNDTNTTSQRFTQGTTQQPKTQAHSILLSDITIYGYDIGFNPGHITYSIEVPYSTAGLSISWTKTSDDVDVEMAGADNIQVGTNNVIIHAYNLKTNEEIFYYIKVVRLDDPSRPQPTQPRVTTSISPQEGLPDASLPSSNAKLSNIIVGGYELSDVFSPEVFAYDVEVDEYVSELTVTPILQETSASYTIKGNEDVKDGSVITIDVLSQNRYYHNTYTVTVHTKASTNASTVILRAVAVGLGVVLVILLITIRKQKTTQKLVDNQQSVGIEKGGYVDPTKIDK